MKALFFISFLGPLLFAQDSLVQLMTDQQLIQAGKASFERNCSGCHGLDAKGGGAASSMLNPRPRNLVEGSFKWRSTPSGTLPTVQDLLRTLEVGVLGASMPSYKELPSQEKLALVAYIRSLRPEFSQSLKDQVPVVIPAPPSDVFSTKSGLLQAAKRGKVIYQKACYLCHGTDGVGDGPSAEGLTDSEDQPIKPAVLHKPYVKGGKTARDLFRSITTGLDGSPMPGFGQLFSDKERWDLVAYIYYLRGMHAGIYTEKDKIQ